eukprot:TRINITY_DN1788_c0_g1_i8.p1 TRINITY_DN1788_c0_g1~~TRINITY_DN1788_c0_g1_i8.p1  ORF type:complete len:203 (-),score=43.03 TRINITY_DN1788_c0_g1_i8:972-1580(-)
MSESDFTEAKQLLLLLNNQVCALESGNSSVLLQTKIAHNVSSLNALTTKLQQGVDQLSPQKRDIWTIKVRRLLADFKLTKESVEKQFQSLNSATKLDQTHLRHTHNHQVQISEYVEENQQLEESLKSADVLLEMVENVTNSVTGQNQNLKRIKRQVLDVVNQFELSRSVLRMMERRMRMDQLIVYGGIVFILLLVLFLWWYR